MDGLWVLLLTNCFNGLLGIIFLVIGYKLFDWCTPNWNFKDAFTKDKVSNGGIVISAFLLGLSYIVSTAVF